MLTKRGWAAVTASVALVLLGTISGSRLALLVAIPLLAFFFADILGFHIAVRALRAEEFSVVRVPVPRRLSVGDELRVSIHVTYRGARSFWAELYDTGGSGCGVVDGSRAVTHWWTTGGTAQLDYIVRVNERGDHPVGPVVVLAVGPLGLCFTEAVLGFGESVLGVPRGPRNRPGRAARAILGRSHGSLAMRKRGFGTDVRSLRPYLGSDDIRHVAWRRSTFENIVVREYEQEGRQDYLLVYDRTSGMGAGPRGSSALDLAVGAGWLVAGLVEQRGEDRIGLWAGPPARGELLLPDRSRRHFAEIQQRLARLDTRPEPFELGAVLSELARRLNVHTHVFVFTLGASAGPELRAGYRAFLDGGHRLCLFTPDLARLFPAHPASPTERWAVHTEANELRQRIRATRAVGIPTISFDRSNANGRVLTAYGRVRAWGRAT
jgi:uncharacterized protein (DUF58 family)